MSNRSSSRRGRRPARSARRHGNNKTGNTLAKQGKIVATNLLRAEEVASAASVVKLTFDQPIFAGDPSLVSSTDVTMSGTSATTRNGISTTPVDFVSVRVNLSGNLTQSKTYTLTIAAAQGLVVPANGVWGNRTATLAT
jgi:hypothetical protein